MMHQGLYGQLNGEEKNLGNMSLFFSRYPVRDFWHISSCSWKKTMGIVTCQPDDRVGNRGLVEESKIGLWVVGCLVTCKYGKVCLRYSSPTQQFTTPDKFIFIAIVIIITMISNHHSEPGVSWALVMIFCQDLSIL